MARRRRLARGRGDRRRTVEVVPFLVLLVAVGTVATTAGADSVPRSSSTLAERGIESVMRDIRGGTAEKVTPPGRGKRTFAVWTGCRFVLLTKDVDDYRFADGSVASVSENPEPMPPKDPSCSERNPTEAEMTAMRTVVDARNAGYRPSGAPAPPPTPLPRYLDPDYRPTPAPTEGQTAGHSTPKETP